MRGYNQVFTISKEVEVEITADDVKDNLDLSEALELYEVSADDLCDHLGFDAVIEWAAEQSEMSTPETVRALFDNGDLQECVVEHIKASPELMQQFGEAAAVTVTELSQPNPLYRELDITGARTLRAVIMGGIVRFKAEGFDDTQEFRCDHEWLAIELLKGLAAFRVE